MNKDIFVHASIIIAATTSIAQAEGTVEIDAEYDVSEDLLTDIDEAFEKINVKRELADSFNRIVNTLTMENESLIQKYFSEFSDETVVAQAADGVVPNSCNLYGSQLSSCYSNCHANCHGACHGSRGWR